MKGIWTNLQRHWDPAAIKVVALGSTLQVWQCGAANHPSAPARLRQARVPTVVALALLAQLLVKPRIAPPVS